MLYRDPASMPRNRPSGLQYRTNPWARVYWHSNGECICFPTVDRLGYGNFSTNRRPEGKRSYKAHRYVWERLYGALPDALEVCHSCNVRGCIRPSHLYVDSHRGNMRYAIDLGRAPRPRRGRRLYVLTSQDHARIQALRLLGWTTTRIWAEYPQVSYTHIKRLCRSVLRS